VLADYERRKAKPRELKPTFSIRKPYLLLSADEVRAFELHVPDQRFRGVTDIFTLSDVYFNQRQTLALTAISLWCGELCGLYQWKAFEKLNTGKWEERPWGGCVTIAGDSINSGRKTGFRKSATRESTVATAQRTEAHSTTSALIGLNYSHDGSTRIVLRCGWQWPWLHDSIVIGAYTASRPCKTVRCRSSSEKNPSRVIATQYSFERG
jgi:hypothetical protein